MDGNDYYPVLIPFQCAPDFCDRRAGDFVEMGNTDSGMIDQNDIDGEGVRDR